MRILLIADVPGMGKVGDVKYVVDAYARDVLIARGLAVLASQSCLYNTDALARIGWRRP